MGYKVNYGALDDLLRAYSTAVAQWSDGISSVIGKEAVIEASSFISGNSADRMKEYLNTAYSFAETSLSLLLEMFRQNFLLYIEAYYQQVDSERHTYINEAELTELRSSLQGKRSQLQQIGIAAENSVRGILDLVSLPNLDISEPDMKLGSMLTSLDELDNAVNGLERAHVSADFSDIDALISQLDAYFQELIGLSKEFKTDFTMRSFVSLSSVPALLMTTKKAYEHLTAQETNVALAAKNLEKRLELEQAELEKRERQAKWAKAAVTIITVAATAVCLSTGVGTLLVPVICGVGKCAFNAAADEYVKNGWNTDQWDSAYIGKEAVKGWFTGFTGAILPPGVGDVVKVSVSATNSALWGGLDNAYDQMTTSGTISDTTSIFFDAEKSGVSSFAGGLVGSVIGDQVKELPIGMGLDKYENPSNDIRHYVGKFIQGSTSEVSSGIGERFASTTVESIYDIERNVIEGRGALDEIDFADRYKEVLSFDNIALDFAKGGAKESISSYFKERTPDPKTGLTPIIQSKLSYETNPETGLTGIVRTRFLIL